MAGTLDVLGWQFRIATNDIQISQLGFFGIAVALLGRNTAVGTFFSALLFGGLITGTSVRNLDPTVFEPALATNLTYMIQGLVVLLVSTDVLGHLALAAAPQASRSAVRWRPHDPGEADRLGRASRSASSRSSSPCRRSRCARRSRSRSSGCWR